MSSIPSQRSATIFWAVDPLHEQPQAQLRSFEAITKLFGKKPLTVHPVAVLSLGRYNPEKLEFQQKWADVLEFADGKLHKLLSPIKHPGLQPAAVIKQEGISVSKSAQAFLKHALENGAQMIAVSSHARKGMARLMLGSFAENLVLQSPIPVLVVNPGSKANSATRLKKVLFPTDFSESSYEAFARTVMLARALELPIRLFHRMHYLYPEVGPAFFYPAVSNESLKAVRQSIKEQSVPWIEYGKKFGVKVTFELSETTGNVAEEILAVAKKMGPDTVIAMASQSNKAIAVLLGSMTRQVLRTATCPVLVVHPNEETVIKRFVDEARLHGYDEARPLLF